MANTVIALKKSATSSAVPADLANGELAINFTDGKLFYKHSNGSIVQFSSGAAGGDSFGTVNANGTLVVADTSGDVLSLIAGSNIQIVGDAINDTITISATGGDISPAFAQANNARDHANSAFAQANTARTGANTVGGYANSAYGAANLSWAQANTSQTIAVSAYGQANIARTGANTVGGYANSAFNTANLAFAKANTADTNAVNAYGLGNSAFAQANTARDHANAAFEQANTGGGGGAYFSGNNGDVGTASGLGDIFRVHTNTLSANVTIYSGNNALAAGPITVEANRTLTIQANARVAIV